MTGLPYNFAVAETPSGRMAILVPAIRDDYPEDLQEALARRREAVLRGRCPCGAEADWVPDGVAFAHEADCPASDEMVANIMRKHGLTVQTAVTKEEG